MLLYRIFFSWFFSAILNFFTPMPGEESMLNNDRTAPNSQQAFDYNDDKHKGKKAS